MASQIKLFRKNWADYERDIVTVTASEGNDIARTILDRSNRTAWGTTGSTDASLTNIVIDMGDIGTIDSLFLLKHNFKSFTVQYWDDVTSAYLDFSPAVGPTANTAASNFYSVASVQTSKIKIIINSTQTADVDKFLYQFIATSLIGQLAGWPIFRSPTLSRGIQEQVMLSGKTNLIQNVGQYSTTIAVENWSSAADLSIIEQLFDSSEGFLFWPCGGDESQFSSVRQGYRIEDIYLVRCKNEFSPEWAGGFYKSGQNLQIDLVEVVT